MPFEIVRNDIVNMRVDAIVNTASPSPVIGYGVDMGINSAAGPQLLKARKRAGRIKVGDCAVTGAYGLEAKYVIHAVGPVWLDGSHGEEELLRRCYDRALAIASEKGCESIAFPLLCAGNHGFPKPLALQTAINAFSSFLMENEMQIYLVVFGTQALELSEKLFHSVKSYIDEHYILEKKLDEYGVSRAPCFEEAGTKELRRQIDLRMNQRRMEALQETVDYCPTAQKPCAFQATGISLDDKLKKLDAGFSETLLKLIDCSGKKDSEIYKKANVDRKLFSKIRKNPAYKPAKATALAFAIALELDLEETKDFIGRAGYALSHSSCFDVIVEYFISSGNYNIYELNEVLFKFDQQPIGGNS